MARKIKNPNDFEPIVVNGCLVEANTIYEIVSKEPSDLTPPIYQELGSTKERMPGVSNTVSLTQADTGFFSASPVFNRTDFKNDWVKREEMANKYYEIFAAPLRTYISEIERIKVPTDDEFFDTNYAKGFLTSTVGEGIQLNTSSPVDRFKLYIALIEGELCMKGKRTDEEKEIGLKDELDPFHYDAQYAFLSNVETKNKKEKQAEIEMDAAYKFGQLLREDTNNLRNLMAYINIPVKDSSSKAELNTLYKTKIESDFKKLKEFIEILERYESDKDYFVLEMDLIAKIKTKKGRELITREGSTYYFNDFVLGSNVKSAVATFLKKENQDLLKQFQINYDS